MHLVQQSTIVLTWTGYKIFFHHLFHFIIFISDVISLTSVFCCPGYADRISP